MLAQHQGMSLPEHREAALDHVCRRARERAGIELDHKGVERINDAIRAGRVGDAIPLMRLRRGRLYLARVGPIWVKVVWSEVVYSVVTVLPRSAWPRHIIGAWQIEPTRSSK